MLEKWKSILIFGNDTIINAINILNKTGLMLLIVCDQNNKLLGTVSDGDIRRGVIKGLDLATKCQVIMNSSPITAKNTSNLK